MGEGKSNPPGQPSEPPASHRLESWKEIANYLKRGVTTVQRWERHERLPVHRHLHDKRGTVYAYKAELDVWWNNRRPKLEAEETKERSKRWLLAGAIVLAGAVVAAAGIGFWLTRPPALPFGERDWVLIARFENRTGEDVFDGALEYALERELSNSRFVNVVPRERVNDTLQLMKKPLDTTINRNVGREICLRDGGIRALITGRVEKLDTTYVLNAALVNPTDGVTVASFSEEAVGQQEVVPAIRRLSSRVRENLGEELTAIQESELKLEKVTTPSLPALQLYSQANALTYEFQWHQAAVLLEQAVEEDPQFASAHFLLAACLGNLGRPEESTPHFERARELADTTTDRERYFILGDWDVLVRLYPDHYWAVSSFSTHYRRTNQPWEALRYALRRADLRPNYFDHQLGAAHAVLLWGDPQQAEPYLQRARKLVSLGEVNPWRAAWLRLFPAQDHWARGNLEKALHEAEQVTGEIRLQTSKDQNALRWHLGSFYLTLGKRRAAEEMFQKMSWPTEKALIAWGLGDEKAAREYLRRARPSYRAAILLARLGLLAETEEMIANPETTSSATAPFLPELWDRIARAELALARGQRTEAIQILEHALLRQQPWPTAYFFMASDSLASAWEQQGNTLEAVEVLEEAARQKRPAVFWPSAPFFWMKNQMRLAQLYRKLGRQGDAEEVEIQLQKLLVHADTDHAILRKLQQRERMAHSR